MKIIFSTLLLTASVLTLSACSSSDKEAQSASSEVQTTQTSESTTTTSTAEVWTKPYPKEAYANFPITHSSTTSDFTIKGIAKHENAMFPGQSIIAIEVSFTNKASQPTSPYMAFVLDFDVQQTNGTITESLNGANGQMGNVSNQDLVKMGDAQVNSGATVDAIIGYSLSDPSLDVGFYVRTSQLTGNPQGFAWSNE